MNIIGTLSEIYVVEDNMNRVYEVVKLEMDKKLFHKKYNLSGRIGDNGGFDINPKITFAFFEPNAGPIASLNLSAVNVNSKGNQCRVTLKRVNGLTYKLHLGGVIVFTILILLILVIWATLDYEDFDYKMFLLLFFSLFYFVLIEGVADVTTTNTKRRVLKILADNNIKYTIKPN